jgi:hypothetical protein
MTHEQLANGAAGTVPEPTITKLTADQARLISGGNWLVKSVVGGLVVRALVWIRDHDAETFCRPFKGKGKGACSGY